VRIGSNTELKNGCVTVFESSRFVTTERFYVSPHTQTRILFGDI